MISGEISMADDNKKLPNGWGDNNDDDDYDFIDDTDEDDEVSAWGNNSPFKKNEPVNFSNANKDSDKQTGQIPFTDKSKEKSKKSVPVKEDMSPKFTPPPAPNIILPNNPEYVIQKHKTSPVLIIVIVILVLIIGMLGSMLFMMRRNKKSDEFDKNASVSDIKKITDNENYNKETETVIAEVTPENVAGKVAGASVNISCSKDNVNQIYASIVKNMDFPMPNRGFILDLNNDGINEMIITNTADMNFVMYYFDGNSIQSCSFGNFMAVDNFVIYQVDGEENKNYIYYRDNYSYKSLQGYYSFPSADELNIFIDYPENNGKYSADWTIDYNKTENYAKGNESTDTFYGQVPDCHDKLLSAFKNYGFEIDENSKYTEINGLYYDELIKALTPDSKPDSESKPSAKADVQVRNDEFHMANLYLCVSGDYSYYEYEMYIDGTVSKTGITSDSEVWLGRASGQFELKIYVTPYNSSGVAGETVIYTDEDEVIYTAENEEEHKKAEVYSCNSLGTINTGGSAYINGYATSYIVDGGSSSCVRTDLRNGWHVTAVRYCFAYDTTWYELYDSDDGDYYGWVNSFNINFTPSYQGGLTDDGRGSEDEDIPEIPMTSPPVTEPPETSPPVTEPPATNPPPTTTTTAYDSWYDYDYSDDYDYNYDYDWSDW